MPNQEQLISVLRQLLLFGGGFFVAKGYLTAEQLLSFVGAFLALFGSVWAIYSRRKAGIVASAASLPDVRQVLTTTNSLADSVTGTAGAKVVKG